MNVPYVEPSYKLNAFNCPYCRNYLKQSWFRVMHDPIDNELMLPFYNIDYDSQTDKEINALNQTEGNTCEPEGHLISQSEYVLFIENISLSKCSQCKKYTIWVRDKLVYPIIG